MNCPTCNTSMSVRDSRKYFDPNEKFNYVLRQRYCSSCNEISMSIEVLLTVWHIKTGEINEVAED